MENPVKTPTDNKKKLKVIGFGVLAVLALVAFGLYFLVKNKQPTPASATPVSATPAATTPAATTPAATTPTVTTPPPYIPKVRYIEFFSDQEALINIGEILAFEPTNSETNLCRNPGVTIREMNNQKTWNENNGTGLYLWNNIIDGNLDTSGHIIYGGQAEKKTQLRIDLQKEYTIGKLILYNRKECCRLRIVGGVIRFYDGNGELILQTNRLKAKNGVDRYPGLLAEQQDNYLGYRNSWYIYVLDTNNLSNPTMVGKDTLI